MKQNQGVFLTGSVTIKVKGQRPELFFDLCAREGLIVWQVKKISDTICVGKVHLKDITAIKRLRRKTVYKIEFMEKKGIPFFIKKCTNRKPLILGLLLSALFVILLSNMVWKIEVKGVHPELENKIRTQLESYNIHPATLKFTIGTPGDIQKALLDDIPELLWVGVTEKGTTYSLEGVEKTIVEEEAVQGPKNLVAAKKGVIVDLFVSKGQPMVKVNDVVKEGDLLVSGEIGEEEQQQLVAAEGEVIAETWYKLQTTVPLKVNYEVLTGNSVKKYSIQLGNLAIPIWGFQKPDYTQIQKERIEKPVYFLNWKLPISFIMQNLQEKENYKETRTQKEAVQIGIKQAERELKSNLDQEGTVRFEKVLQERKENGKVKLILYFKAKENIAQNQPISQGD